MFQTDKINILSNKRQNEMKDIITSLKKFNPTKVALEFPQEKEEELNKRYAYYLNGDYQLTTSEIDQIGLRLAMECQLHHVYAVDWNKAQKDVPNLGKWKDTAEFKAVTDKGATLLSGSNTSIQNHSLKEYLLELNDTQHLVTHQEMYMKIALIGGTSCTDGAAWTAKYWYYRNMLIYKNLVNLIDSSHERIFVMYGAGHLYLLLQFLRDSKLFEVKVASDYLV